MIKKIFSIVLLSLILSHCGYTPIYSSKSLNFKIDKIKTIGDQKVGNYLLKKLKIFNKDDNNKKKYDLIINSKIDKNISSKDKKGNPIQFQIILNINLKTENDLNDKREIIFSESVTYNNNNNKFDLKLYEDSIIKNLSEKIFKDILKYLQNIN